MNLLEFAKDCIAPSNWIRRSGRMPENHKFIPGKINWKTVGVLRPAGFILGFVTDACVSDVLPPKSQFVRLITGVMDKFKHMHEWSTDYYSTITYNVKAEGAIVVQSEDYNVYAYKYQYDTDADLVSWLESIPGRIRECAIYLNVATRLGTRQTIEIKLESAFFSDEYGDHETFIMDTKISGPSNPVSYFGMFVTNQSAYVKAFKNRVDYVTDDIPQFPWQYPTIHEVYWADCDGLLSNGLIYLFNDGKGTVHNIANGVYQSHVLLRNVEVYVVGAEHPEKVLVVEDCSVGWNVGTCM